jgi:hypothetical protein
MITAAGRGQAAVTLRSMRNCSSSCCRQDRSCPSSCHQAQLALCHYECTPCTIVHNDQDTTQPDAASQLLHCHIQDSCTVALRTLQGTVTCRRCRSCSSVVGKPCSVATSRRSSAGVASSPPTPAGPITAPLYIWATAKPLPPVLLTKFRDCAHVKGALLSLIYQDQSTSRMPERSLYASSFDGVSKNQPPRRRASPSAPP